MTNSPIIPAAEAGSSTLIDEMIARQQEMTVVERFAKREKSASPAMEPYYRSLIPLTAPAKDEQYVFEVDMDKCTGCKACVTACHSLNGLDDGETWREVGVLVGGTARHPIQRTVTTACHHCADPGCLKGCPVLAYEKDEATGIVRHLDDQCIGCKYCILTCPYEVPKYSPTRGIVRKCDMCHDRLSAGEAPACVQGCPTSAIAIRIVKKSAIAERASREEFLPDAPSPRITKPGTLYKSARELSPRLIAADHYRPSVQPAHWPLVWMLVLTQAGAGFFFTALFGHPNAAIAGVIFTLTGLAASAAHLGQPRKAWRSFLGWRTSWLSREILALSAFAAISCASLMVATLPGSGKWREAAFAFAGATGLIAVFCSAFVYHVTHRAVWRRSRSFVRFFWTTALFATGGLFVGNPSPGALHLFTGLLGGKLLWELAYVIRGAGVKAEIGDIERSGRLLRGPLLLWTVARFGAGGAALVLAFHHFSGAALAFVFTGEIFERLLFFRAGVSTKMPGGAA